MRDFRIFGRKPAAWVGEIFKWTLLIAVVLVVLSFFIDWSNVTWGSAGKGILVGVICGAISFTVNEHILRPIAETYSLVEDNQAILRNIYYVLTEMEKAVARLENPDLRPRGGR